MSKTKVNEIDHRVNEQGKGRRMREYNNGKKLHAGVLSPLDSLFNLGLKVI